jgi:hypothetical protein
MKNGSTHGRIGCTWAWEAEYWTSIRYLALGVGFEWSPGSSGSHRSLRLSVDLVAVHLAFSVYRIKHGR